MRFCPLCSDPSFYFCPHYVHVKRWQVFESEQIFNLQKLAVYITVCTVQRLPRRGGGEPEVYLSFQQPGLLPSWVKH
jgi:hypothetical protein